MPEITAEDIFAKPESLKSIEESRKPFLEATKTAIKPFFEGIEESSRILDVGAGHGALSSIIPEAITRNLIQLDLYKHMAEETKSRDTKAQFVVATGYNLPFRGESFDVVMGLSSYDVFEDLDFALRETQRVLTANGKFMHFLDFGASVIPILHDFRKKSHKVSFPYTDEFGLHVGFNFVDRKLAQSLIRKVPEPYRELFQRFINQPEEDYIFIRSDPNFQQALQAISSITNALTSGRGEIVIINDYFENKLLTSLQKNGFRITFSGSIEGSAVLKRQGLPESLITPKSNFIVNRTGRLVSDHNRALDSVLKGDELFSIASILTVVAEKQT